MHRPVRYALRTLRWLVVAVCGLMLVATLIMWPRSYFYEDSLHGPGWGERVIATFGNSFFIDFEELERVKSFQYVSGLRGQHIDSLGYHWVPFGWAKDGSGNKTGKFYVMWYCVPVFALGMTLIAVWPSPTSWIRFLRFRVHDFLIAAVIFAWTGVSARFAYRQLGDGGTVMAIETCVLLLGAYAASRHAFGSKKTGRWGAVIVAVCCLAGVVGLGLFYWHIAAIFPR